MEILKKIIEKKGTINQALLAIEECSELQKAITKALRNENGDEYVPLESKRNVMEEIADVLIMIEQLKIMWNITDEDINAWKEAKLNRLEERYF